MVFKYLVCVEGKAYKRGLWETSEGKKEADFFAWSIDWLTSQTVYISVSSHGWPGSSKGCLGKGRDMSWIPKHGEFPVGDYPALSPVEC